MDGAILIHELIHSLHKQKSKVLILKLDLTKIFDRINWDFLVCMMEKFGFDAKWTQWILSLTTNPSFSILINGCTKGFFKISCWIHKGDHLSPYLFIIVMKALGKGMKYLHSIGKIKGLQLNTHCPYITHSQFVYDTFLIAYPSVQKIHTIKTLLNFYEVASGKAINYHKSKNYDLIFPPCLLRVMSRLTIISIKSLPNSYLGLHLFHGEQVGNFWEKIKN